MQPCIHIVRNRVMVGIGAIALTLVVVAFLLATTGNMPGLQSGNSSANALRPPSYLSDLVPSELDGLVTADLDASGRHKLVVWSQFLADGQGPNSFIELVELTPGYAAREIWKSQAEPLYQPKIYANPQWTYRGHRVYLITRNAGAAWEIGEPIWIDENETVHKLSELNGDYIEVKSLAGASPGAGGRLSPPSPQPVVVCHGRPGPEGIDVPEVYVWNGDDFSKASGIDPE